MKQNTLIQYINLKAEMADLEEAILKSRYEIEKMEKRGDFVSDLVKGTRKDGTYGNIRITGYTSRNQDRAKELLKKREMKLNVFYDKLLELTNEVDDFINDLEDSRMRRMLRYKYMDNLTWVQVAHRMGKGSTADGCRMEVKRFL